MSANAPWFIIGDRVKHPDYVFRDCEGTIVELDDAGGRARVKWDTTKKRTWIRYGRLRFADQPIETHEIENLPSNENQE